MEKKNKTVNCHPFLMKFIIFGLNIYISVDIRPLPCAWLAELLGVQVQDHKKIKYPPRVHSSLAAKGLNKDLKKFNFFNIKTYGMHLTILNLILLNLLKIICIYIYIYMRQRSRKVGPMHRWNRTLEISLEIERRIEGLRVILGHCCSRNALQMQDEPL